MVLLFVAGKAVGTFITGNCRCVKQSTFYCRGSQANQDLYWLSRDAFCTFRGLKEMKPTKDPG